MKLMVKYGLFKIFVIIEIFVVGDLLKNVFPSLKWELYCSFNYAVSDTDLLRILKLTNEAVA